METDTYGCAELSGSLLEVISMKARNEREILKNNSCVPDCHLLHVVDGDAASDRVLVGGADVVGTVSFGLGRYHYEYHVASTFEN